MKKIFYTLLFMFFMIPLTINAKVETVNTCEYSTNNLGTITFKFKFDVQKSSNYFYSIDQKNSFAFYDNASYKFDTLMKTKNIYIKYLDSANAKNYNGKCPDAVRYATINKKIYVYVGNEEELKNVTVFIGVTEHNFDDYSPQLSYELKIVQSQADLEKSEQNLKNRIDFIEDKKQDYLNSGCYDKGTYNHEIKKTQEGISYIVWEDIDKVYNCNKKLTTLSGVIANFNDDINYFKKMFPTENVSEYEKTYKQYKNDYDKYKEFYDENGEVDHDNDSDEDSDLNKGDLQRGCDVIPPEIRKWINNILKFVRYVALALVIALGALDFMKAAGSGEPDAMKKAGQSFMKRMIAVVILFLLPVIVDFILNMINIYGVDPENIDCLKNSTTQ